jgi:hypothetical protein
MQSTMMENGWSGAEEKQANEVGRLGGGSGEGDENVGGYDKFGRNRTGDWVGYVSLVLV